MVQSCVHSVNHCKPKTHFTGILANQNLELPTPVGTLKSFS